MMKNISIQQKTHVCREFNSTYFRNMVETIRIELGMIETTLDRAFSDENPEKQDEKNNLLVYYAMNYLSVSVLLKNSTAVQLCINYMNKYGVKISR
jgi:hypothetical protein